MEKIRQGVFETNSSSTHALTVGKKLEKDYLPYGNNLKIRWFDEERTLTTLQEKVSYLVSHIASWYQYNAEDYEDLLNEIKSNYDFKRIEKYVLDTYGKKIVFPEYEGNIEDVVEINHQLTSWNNNLDEILEDLIEEPRDYLAEVLEDGKIIEFGRD